MAGNIKGITIEFDGNTTKLDKALKQVDKETSNIDKELKKVNNALKFSPTSVELWRQKQQLLTQKITDTQKRLDALRQAQKQMDGKDVDKNSAEYRNLQREIVETESKLKTFKAQLRAIGNVKLRAASEQLKQIGSKATAAGHAMAGISRAAGLVTGAIAALTVKSGKWADDLNTLSKQYSVGTKELQLYAAAARLVDVDVEDILKSQIKLTRNMSSASKGSERQAEAFEALGVSYQNADGTLRDGEQVWQDVITALGKVDNETQRNALAMDLLGKSAAQLNPLIEDGGETYKRVAETMKKYGLDFLDQKTIDKANEFNDQLDTMRAIGLLAFQSLGAELAGVLEPVLVKVADAVGRFAQWLSGLNPTILAIIAGVAGLIAILSPALLLFGALASAAGALLGALAGIPLIVVGIGAAIGALVAAFATAYASSEEFRTAINEIATEIGAKLKPLVDMVVAGFQDLISTIAQTAQEIATDLAPVIEALKPVIMFVADLIIGVLGVAFTSMISYIKMVAAVVSGLVKLFAGAFKGIVNTVKNAQKRLKTIINAIKSAFNGLVGIAGRVKGAFLAVKNAITNPIQSAVSIVRSAISRIKSILSGRLSLPHIKLPHFKISGKFSLDPPQIPKIGVSWYAKGGIFDQPTLAGIGEAGPEAVIPLDKLWKKLDAIAAAGFGGGITLNVYAPPGMNIDQLTTKVEQMLIKQQKQRMKAWGY